MTNKNLLEINVIRLNHLLLSSSVFIEKNESFVITITTMITNDGYGIILSMG